jgi:hypothetical protein
MYASLFAAVSSSSEISVQSDITPIITEEKKSIKSKLEHMFNNNGKK